MKQTLLTTAFILIYTFGWGQLNMGANNRIGIGNPSPQAPLHIGQTAAPSITRVRITTGVANESGLTLENLTSTSPAAASNGKVLTVDNTGKVIVTIDNSNAATSYWQSIGNDIINNNTGTVRANNFVVGNSSIAVAGAIRWNGTNFEGYNGSAWLPLTAIQTYSIYYVPAVQTSGGSVLNSPCQATCEGSGGVAIADPTTGIVCISRDNRAGNNVVSNVFTGYTCYNGNTNLGVLAKCLCRIPN